MTPLDVNNGLLHNIIFVERVWKPTRQRQPASPTSPRWTLAPHHTLYAYLHWPLERRVQLNNFFKHRG
jgi:hypothetical protein